MRLHPCILALGGLFIAATATAAPKVDQLFPPGAARGQTVAVTATGNFPKWPVQTWVDRSGVRVEAESDKGKLKVTVDADAQPGVCWLRLTDAEGAASPRPFVIGTLPETIENEPNDAPGKAQQLAASTVVSGRFAKSGDVDAYSIALDKGQTLVASMMASRTLGSPFDGVLQVCNPEGIVLAQNDDARGVDPEIVYTAPAGGVYLVRAFAFPATPDSTIGFAGGDAFIYRLTITTGGFIDHALPLAASRDKETQVELFGWNLPEDAKKLVLPAAADQENRTLWHALAANTLPLPAANAHNVVAAESSDPGQPQRVELPAVISGRIEAPRDVDAFSFSAKKGEKLAIEVVSFGLGYPLDPYLQVTDAAGKVASEADDSRKQRDAELTFSAPADGEYRLLIRDLHRHGGFRYVYRLSIAPVQADFDLRLAADSFVLTPGKPLEIPVTINRRESYAGEIEVQATSLPEGVTATPVKSEAKGNSAKSVKLSLTTEQGPLSGSFRIVGIVAGESPVKKTAAYPLSAFSAELADVWLTVTPPAAK